MTAAELAQAFRDAGDMPVRNAMLGCLHAAWEFGEIAALAIAEARVREMWAKRGYPYWIVARGPHGPCVTTRSNSPDGPDPFLGDTLADCLHAALQAALEAPDGE